MQVTRTSSAELTASAGESSAPPAVCGESLLTIACRDSASRSLRGLSIANGCTTLRCAADEPILQCQLRGLKERLQEGWLEVDVVDGIEHGVAEVVQVVGHEVG